FFQSLGLTPAAHTAIRTWPGPGCGSGRSTISRTSGPPNWLKRTAFIIRPDLDPGCRGCCVYDTVPAPHAGPELSATAGRRDFWGCSHGPSRVVNRLTAGGGNQPHTPTTRATMQPDLRDQLTQAPLTCSCRQHARPRLVSRPTWWTPSSSL